MIQETFTIVNKMGLHARPAAMFVKKASQFTSSVWVEKDGERVNGKSIMGLMMLAANCGCQLMVETNGPDEAEAIAGLGDLIKGGFNES